MLVMIVAMSNAAKIFVFDLCLSCSKPMNIIIRTQNSQRRVAVDTFEELDQKIRDIYSVEKYSLYSDKERTKPLSEVENNQTIYLSYEAEEAKVYKQEPNCSHSPDAVCPRCATLGPPKRGECPETKTKYLSYKSYLEMLEKEGRKEDVFDYRPRVCKDHTDKTKCSRCMDRQITLVSQVYRRIDHVEFDNQYCVENFVNAWRDSGRQRIGLLVGRLQEHSDVPMGRKAVVSCIWEVDQENFPDGAVLNRIPSRFLSDEMSIVGVIYTDLAVRDGQLHSCKRSLGYFASTAELHLIDLLGKKTGSEDFFGICLSVNESKGIEPEVFMVTEQFSAMMDAGVLSLTADPRYFQTSRDIVYFITNEYNKKVSMKASPLVPLDYFIVKCEVGVKNSPVFEDATLIKKPTPRKLSAYFGNDYSFAKFKSFYLLFDLERLLPTIIGGLFTSIIRGDEDMFREIASHEEFLQMRSMLLKFNEQKWSCAACTYLNEAYAASCDMCGSKKLADCI